jgi:WD40 repeat protein
VVWHLEAGKDLGPSRLLRPSVPRDQRGYFESGLTPDGRLHWWAGPRYPPTNYRVEVRRVETGEVVRDMPLPYSKEVGHIGALIDPTGRLIWVGDGRGGDYRLELDGDAPVAIVARTPHASTAGGDWMVIPAENAHLGTVAQLVDGGTDRPWLSFRPNDPHSQTVWSFSPNGKYLACGSRSGTVTVIDLRDLARAIATFEAGLPAGY